MRAVWSKLSRHRLPDFNLGRFGRATEAGVVHALRVYRRMRKRAPGHRPHDVIEVVDPGRESIKRQNQPIVPNLQVRRGHSGRALDPFLHQNV